MFFNTPVLPAQSRRTYFVEHFPLSKTPDVFTQITNLVNASCSSNQKMIDFTLLPGDPPVIIVVCEETY
jgi:hypothetical protein